MLSMELTFILLRPHQGQENVPQERVRDKTCFNKEKRQIDKKYFNKRFLKLNVNANKHKNFENLDHNPR